MIVCNFACVLLIFALRQVSCKGVFTKWLRLETNGTRYGASYATEGSLSKIQCVARCAESMGCISVNVNSYNLSCELSMEHPMNNTLPVFHKPGWTVYYSYTEGCPYGWLSHLGSCYYFDDKNVTYNGAQDICGQLGAHMVIAESEAENLFLKAYMTQLQNVNASFWLGMMFETIDGLWIWYNGDLLTQYTDWYPGEPNNLRGIENCAIFWSMVNYTWVDVGCLRVFRTVCEKDEKPLL